ncbi:hypothetical protein BR93DRAFT_988955 [Coniochaeta sp. PMI_546]|nr:hypothetical protein BR93DRAFT_988955 [Coniochaeta sp. PMI_546]
MPPRIHHFIVRPEVVNRTPTGLAVEQPLVPLIPLDELPAWLDIVGIPRQLTPEQTTGLSNLGCYERQDVHQVEIVIDDPDSDAGADSLEPTTALIVGGGQPPAVVSGDIVNYGLKNSRWADAMTDDGLPGKPKAVTAPASAASQAEIHPADRTMAHVSPPSTDISTAPGHAIHDNKPTSTTPATGTKPADNPSLPSPPGTTIPQPKHSLATTSEPGPKKRNYCRHWVHHGTCKWGPYCRFAHSMPATPSGLAEVGLSEFPSWWTAAMGLALASPGSLGPRSMPYGDVGMGVRMHGMGYGYGYLPGGFVSGYGPARFGGGLGGYGRKEREVHPLEREGERVRRVKVEAADGGGMMLGMRNLDVAEKLGSVGVQGVVAVQAPPVARGSVIVSNGGKTRELELERQSRQEVQEVALPPHKLVDV